MTGSGWIREGGSNLRHIMDFGEGPLEILILNSGKIVNSQKELVEEAIDFL